MAKSLKYIDFHCHPSLKTYLGEYEEKHRDNCWEEIDISGLVEWIDMLLGNIIDSQSSLSQHYKGRVKLLVAGIYPTEIPILTGELIKIDNKVANILLASYLIPELSHPLLKAITSKRIGYSQAFDDLKNHLLKSRNIEKGFHLVHSASDIKENTLNVILSIEGAHALMHDTDNYTDEEVVNRLDSLKKGSERYLYLTLTHITRNPVCNHAWGIKDIKDDRFIPVDYGISDLGKKIIDKALENTNTKRVYIDVKHMSLRARLQYYDLLKSKYNNRIPVIASHTGVTGVSYRNLPVYEYHYKKRKKCVQVEYYIPEGLMSAYFNPWSINLYDEEINIIIESGGLIGINLDERIIGTKHNKKKNRIEYFSESEFEEFKPAIDENLDFFKSRLNYAKAVNDDPLLMINRDLKHLCNNILHIVKIGGKRAWDHICIGSDFDGLVNAVECCKTAEKYEKLERRLERMLPKMAESDKHTNYYTDNIEDKVSRIMYKNAGRFISTNFT